MFRIPIGIDLEHFPLGDADARRRLVGFVVGSFVKDGVGMDEGLEPKLIKGPDTFVARRRSACASRSRSCSCC